MDSQIQIVQSEQELDEFYNTIKQSIIDVAQMEEDGINTIKQFIYDRAETGDLLRVRVNLNNNDFITKATFVRPNSTTQLDANVFLPFQTCQADEVQIGNSIIKYVDNVVNVNGVDIAYNEPFVLEGRRVVLAKGSVVIILEDSLVDVFPYDGLQTEIIQNEGFTVFGDIVTGTTVLVERKESEGTTSVKSFVFFHDPVTDERIVVCETNTNVNDSNTASETTISIANNGEDSSAEPTISYSTTGFGIRSISDEGKESIATIDENGLSFSSDDSSVLFGNTSQFRMKYNTDTDTIQIQYFDGQNYITKAEYGR